MGASFTGVGWWLQVAAPGVRAPSGLAPFGAQTPEERLAYGGPAGRRVGTMLQSPAVCGPVAGFTTLSWRPKFANSEEVASELWVESGPMSVQP